MTAHARSPEVRGTGLLPGERVPSQAPVETLMASQEGEGAVTAEELSRIGLFGGLGRETLEALAQTLTVTTLADGATLFSEGELGRELYVVLTGGAQVLRRRDGVDTLIATLEPGDWFGEGSALAVQPRSATVRANPDLTALCIKASDLNGLYRADPRAYALLVLNIARDLSRQLRTLREEAFRRDQPLPYARDRDA